MSAASAELVYRLPGVPGGSRPGAHRSQSLGPGLAFAGHARLFDQPDPRRLDLRASLRSTRREWLVRTNRQRSAVNIQVIVDVSASMHFGSAARCKLDVAADVIESLGTSAFRQGDAVGLSGFDVRVRSDLFHPPRSSRGIGMALADRLRTCTVEHEDNPAESAASGWQLLRQRLLRQKRAAEPAGSTDAPTALMQCIAQMASRPALVLLISDFHWPLDRLPLMLTRLSPACVVPLVLWDRAETEPPVGGSWATMRDVESGEQRSLWLSASGREAWRSRVHERRALIRTLCAKRSSNPFFIEGAFDADALSRYFIETVR